LGERVIPLFEVDREAVVAVRLNHGVERCTEFVAAVLTGEQADILLGRSRRPAAWTAYPSARAKPDR
jgi:hypothetical protein